MLKNVKNSLGMRSTVFLGTMLFVVMAAATILNTEEEKKVLLRHSIECNAKISSFVLTAMRDALMRGNQDTIQQQLDKYKGLKHVKEINLVSPEGIIKRSSNRDLLDKKEKNPYAGYIQKGDRYEGIDASGKVFLNITPLINSKECVSCHGKDGLVLGGLVTAFDWKDENRYIVILRDKNIIVMVVGLILISIFAGLFIYAKIVNPLKNLETAMKNISRADFSQQLDTAREDEIGNLTRIFNKMVLDLKTYINREKELRSAEQERNRALAQVIQELETEVSERVKAQKKLQDAYSLNKVTLESARDGILVVDVYGKIKLFNNKFVLLWDIPAKILETHDDNLIFEHILKQLKDPELFFAQARKLYADNTSSCLDILELKDGRFFERYLQAQYEEGNVIAGVWNFRDISARKEIEKKQRLVQLGKMIIDLAHEISNPLMVIQGRAQLALMSAIKDEEAGKALKVIMEYSLQAKDILQRLFKFARSGENAYKPLDFTRTVDSMLMLVENRFKFSNIGIKRNYPQGTPLVLADEQQLQEVILNILNNAYDAMPRGGIIEINMSYEREFIRTEIKDTGKGMPEDVLKKIFEPFFTTKEKSAGLGLSVCLDIIKAHGGRLEYESAPGRGTTAIILLPVIK